MPSHWSDWTTCLCGQRFKVGSTAEARHRHNFPAYCRNRKRLAEKLAELEDERPLHQDHNTG